MTILLLEKVSPSLRGDLSRWLIEVQAGVFVGRINDLVREALWTRATVRAEDGTVILIWRINNEQGFEVRSWQARQYIPIDFDGVWLTLRPSADT